MTDGNDNISEISTIVIDDKVVMKLCAMMVFYVVDMGQADAKKAFLLMFDEYTAEYGSRLRWTTNPTTGSWKKLANGISSYITPHDWLLSQDPDTDFVFHYHAGAKKDEASDIGIEVRRGGKMNVLSHHLSSVGFRFPLQDIMDGVVDMPALLQRWCGFLKPHHAHAGIALNRFETYRKRGPVEMRETELLLRFPGLQYYHRAEADYDTQTNHGLYHGPRCADWLIALSEPFVDKLGGVQTITTNMHPLPVIAYDGGLVLQAGDYPGIGEKDTPASLPDYVHLARVIEPIRAIDPMPHLVEPDPQNPEKLISPYNLMNKWCSRFWS